MFGWRWLPSRLLIVSLFSRYVVLGAGDDAGDVQALGVLDADAKAEALVSAESDDAEKPPAEELSSEESFMAAFYVSEDTLKTLERDLAGGASIDLQQIYLLVTDDLPDKDPMVPVDLRGTDFSNVDTWIVTRGLRETAEEFVNARARFLAEPLNALRAPQMSAAEWREVTGIEVTSIELQPLDGEPDRSPVAEPAADQDPAAIIPQPYCSVAEALEVAGGPYGDAGCSAHEGCKGLKDPCCPTLAGLMLDCCDSAPLRAEEASFHTGGEPPLPADRPLGTAPAASVWPSPIGVPARTGLSSLPTGMLDRPPIVPIVLATRPLSASSPGSGQGPLTVPWGDWQQRYANPPTPPFYPSPFLEAPPIL